jgi:molybdate transport system substrate-binding protein
MVRPLHLLSSMATRALLVDVVARWHAAGGAPVHVESVGGVDAARRVVSGEPVDAVLLASDAIGRLVSEGAVEPSTVRDVARCDVAIAVPAGRSVGPLVDGAALRAAVVAARRVAYSTGPSGVALMQLFLRWDLVAAAPERFVQAPPGVPVGRLLAQGEADLGFQQRSELIDVPGVVVLGGMPPGFEIVTTFRVARGRAGAPAAELRPFFDFLHSPALNDLRLRHGMAPMAA